MKRAVECLILGVALLAGCSDSGSDTAGATSETTNGIAVVALDEARNPIPQARVTLFKRPGAVPAESPSEDTTVFHPSYVTAIETATADDSGMVQFETQMDQCQNARCYVEGIAGEDSSLMVWTRLDAADSSTKEVGLLPSVSLTVRTGVAASDFAVLDVSLMLDETPYLARNDGGEFVFPHVPSGKFAVVMWNDYFADVSLDAGTSVDTLVDVPGFTREFVLEDFDDGDSLNNLAKTYRNYGWYYVALGSATWIKPDSAGGFGSAIVDDARGKHLSLQFDLGDSGYVLLGSHLGLDTGYYDLSALTAIRMRVRGDCDFSFALEHYKDIGDNNFQKSLWHATADTTWKEFVFRPGREKLNASVYQVEWKNIAPEIGFVSIFANSGSFLEIDEIVFEGIDSVEAPAP